MNNFMDRMVDDLIKQMRGETIMDLTDDELNATREMHGLKPLKNTKNPSKTFIIKRNKEYRVDKEKKDGERE